MPSFFYNNRVGKPTNLRGCGLSRVNSFQRHWDDDGSNNNASGSGGGKKNLVNLSEEEDDDDTPQLLHSSQPLQPPSSAYTWSPSPEPVKRKLLEPTMPVPTAAVNGNVTGAEARRRAILAALGGLEKSDPPRPLGASKSLPAASSSSTGPRVPKALPDLSKTLPELKRSRPWEEDISSKKVTRTDSSFSTSTRNNSIASKDGALSIGPTVKRRGKIFLSTEQQRVLKLVVEEGKSVFFTGSAGTGKSVLLREIIAALRRKYSKSPDAVAVTASTGIAACNIGGVTLHSFGGCGLAVEDANDLVRKVKMNRKAASRWSRTKVLIVDEISMVDGDLFDKFNKIGKILRRKPDKPFGGIQIIVTGDFFQLPPVTKGGREPSFCFEATTWAETMDLSINLTKVFRQSDQTFVNMLNEMRFGTLSPESINRFRSLDRPILLEGNIEPTELFPRREDVERSNNQRLNALSTDGYSYPAADGGALQDRAAREKALANFMAPANLSVKVDAQVMLIKNVDETLVNGSMGRVIGFSHKLQYAIDAKGEWRPEGIYGDEYEDESEQKRQKREELREQLQAKTHNSKPFPVVRFTVPGGGFRDMLVEPDSFKTELPNGEIQVSRTQVPLILAWAMSIHKSQGQTLDRVKVDLSKVFEKGQAYVALSRATSLEGLQVRGFQASKVQVHRKVVAWSATLKTFDD